MTLHWWFLLETQLALGVWGLQCGSSACHDEHGWNQGCEYKLSPYLALPVTVTLCLPAPHEAGMAAPKFPSLARTCPVLSGVG